MFPRCLQQLLGLTAILSALRPADASYPFPAPVPGKAFDRFVTIWLENQDFDQVTYDPKFVDLTRQGILQTRYYAHTHPSQPNYLAAVGGDYFGLDHDGMVRVPENVSTIIDLLDTKNISWSGYMEDLPGPGFVAAGSDGETGNGQWDYVRKHNPFISYDSVRMVGERLANLVSFEDFEHDLELKQLPQFVFMTPNMMHDGHNTTLKYATSWVHELLTALLVHPVFTANKTLIQVTYDEAATYTKPNKIASLLLGSAVPTELHGTQDNTFYTHYSVLSTMQNNWGLPNLGRYDVGANVFAWVAGKTGWTKNRDPPGVDAVDSSVPYPGFLSSKSTVPMPPPNLKLVGAGGQGVLDKVKKAWEKEAGKPTPYDGSGAVYDGGKNPPVYKPQAANTV